jgi:hypothetical protein
MSTQTAGPGPVPKESEKDANEGKEWIEIALTAPDGTPVSGVRYRVTTPKGKTLEGSTSQNGKTKIVRLAKGRCKVEWQRLWNLGYRDRTGSHRADFLQAYGLDRELRDLEPHLARTENDHFLDDTPDEETT